MRYLEYPCLQFAQSMLTGLENQASRIHVQLECFSCKNTSEEKKVAKEIQDMYTEDITDTSAFGPLELPANKKTFLTLISVLMTLFPTFSFGKIQPYQFVKEVDPTVVQVSIDTQMREVVEGYCPEFQTLLWKAIHQVVEVSNCEIFSFVPGNDGEEQDPFAEEGTIWSFNYFFYQKEAKKVLFFSVRCVSRVGELSEWMIKSLSDEESEEEERELDRHSSDVAAWKRRHGLYGDGRERGVDRSYERISDINDTLHLNIGSEKEEDEEEEDGEGGERRSESTEKRLLREIEEQRKKRKEEEMKQLLYKPQPVHAPILLMEKEYETEQ
ncbi:putative repressor of rna polymerase iii transcription [Monocercomonoides exilis]|uniref:putative repressor of rna polymerase iii transcription n=1 Tax=Monocercomonoides exilis TaxID=2049356 RepID=UPI0035595FB8|nr:putative repressor of rna polymerase iii transcription [Monocercomonoides exilis]|eukprot:MONOS_7937.1-p1 / transcript=MONOS_7937.1 / gene=MONOS_7937 / organism=Monocercomonoides_exilis_PA203 / gene_product=repressor of rna polymerase iii transcription, putative / transcript_product=repressor of rna polymerase iii transcription, putative / location=Mono_scaffold00286:13375-14519(-) / protein_length=326 / sequence_SO=supercontig / SO=protein_coding / is_pseudo=false